MFRASITITFFVLLTAAVATISCNSSKHASSKRLPGTWQVSPITIDGSNKDWPNPYPEYDEKAMLGYAVSNDKENLYITVETGDPATQLKILRNGLTVWIDRKGEKEEVTAINFPIPANQTNEPEKKERPRRQQFQPGQGGTHEKQRFELEDKVTAALGEAKEYSLQGFKNCNFQFPINEKDTCGIIVHMALDTDNELVWEAVVPFRSFYFKPEITRTDKGKAMSICIETEGSKRPPGERKPDGGGGMRPGFGFGMGGGMGMGMQMGGGAPRGGGRKVQNNGDIMESLYKSTKTYKKFGIAWLDKAAK